MEIGAIGDCVGKSGENCSGFVELAGVVERDGNFKSSIWRRVERCGTAERFMSDIGATERQIAATEFCVAFGDVRPRGRHRLQPLERSSAAGVARECLSLCRVGCESEQQRCEDRGKQGLERRAVREMEGGQIHEWSWSIRPHWFSPCRHCPGGSAGSRDFHARAVGSNSNR